MSAQQQTQKKPTHGTLQRGSACLSCRRRKLRCDGRRPYCIPCTKHRRTHECEYDDSRRKSRTQLLREKLAALEQKVNELESASGVAASYSSSSSVLSTESFPCMTSSQPALVDHLSSDYSMAVLSTPAAPLSMQDPSASIFPQNFGWLEEQTRYSMNGFTLDPVALRQPTPESHISFSQETQVYLLETFTAHRAECYFYTDLTRFQTFLLQQIGDRPHPALLHAIYLLACYFSRDPQLQKHEIDLLKLTLNEISVSLSDSAHLVHIIQASSLLALYCYYNARYIEGYRHAFIAARLAVSLGLHQIQYPTDPAEQCHTAVGYNTIFERTSTFWQVYMVDRAWCCIHGNLSLLANDDYRGQITTPMLWQYDPAQCVDNMFYPGDLNQFLNPANTVLPMYSMPTPAFKILASAIYSRAFSSSTPFSESHPSNPHFLNMVLQHVQPAIPPFTGREFWRIQAPYIDTELLIAHTMLQLVDLKLCESEVHSNNGDTKILWIVDWLTFSIEQLQEDDYGFLDPLIAGLWSQAAKLLMQRAKRMKNEIYQNIGVNNGATPSAVAFLDHCVGVLLRALQSLSFFTQVAGGYLGKLNQEYLSAEQTSQPNIQLS